MPEGWELRRADVDDAAGLARVHVRAWQAAYRGVMPDEALDALDVARRTEGWRRLLEGPHRAGLTVAAGPGLVLGFAHAGAAREAATGDDGELFALNVDPAAWRGGVGTALLAAAEADLLAGGHATARLWVVTANPRARAFYSRHGWRADGVERTARLQVAGHAVDVAETRYAKTLTTPRRS
ncbi:GNAT family N-acetyltransferase [Aquipuribacter sp. SD81]|uniref:GNAT family N-acetyltransferase n=1 Tax=Aquipuribacter sp. SD81 TaxID=3127703 RepID=UPI003019E9F9